MLSIKTAASDLIPIHFPVEASTRLAGKTALQVHCFISRPYLDGDRCVAIEQHPYRYFLYTVFASDKAVTPRSKKDLWASARSRRSSKTSSSNVRKCHLITQSQLRFVTAILPQEQNNFLTDQHDEAPSGSSLEVKHSVDQHPLGDWSGLQLTDQLVMWSQPGLIRGYTNPEYNFSFSSVISRVKCVQDRIILSLGLDS